MTPEFKTLCEAFEALAKKLDSRLTRMEMHFGLAVDTDPAIGHPELPLAEADDDEADIRWAPVEQSDDAVLAAAVQCGKTQSLEAWASTHPSDNEIPSIPVEVGGNYYTRSGNAARVTSTRDDHFHGEVRVKGSWLSYNWHANGQSYTGVSRLDIVKTTPL